MSNDLRALLAQFRDAAKTEREKGTYFERLAVAFIKNDPGMAHLAADPPAICSRMEPLRRGFVLNGPGKIQDQKGMVVGGCPRPEKCLESGQIMVTNTVEH